VPLSWPWGTSLQDYQNLASKKSLWRYTIDTRNSNPTVTKTLLWDRHVAWGTVNARVASGRHRYIYLTVGAADALGANEVAPPQGIAKYDCDTGRCAAQWFPECSEFCGEPMFAPKRQPATLPRTERTTSTSTSTSSSAAGSSMRAEEEDDGYILSVLFNGQRKESELVVLNAKDISAGPVTRIPLGLAVPPHGLHGTLVETAIGTADEIERRAKLADKIESRGNRWNEVKSDFSGLGLRLDDMEEYFGDWNPFA
jgi:all-trans-8'-apo-beta-carotenal 15,15'-oxygenase